MFHLLWTAIIGLVVGALAKLIIPGKEPGGIFITMLIGIAGGVSGNMDRPRDRALSAGTISGIHYVAGGRAYPAGDLPFDQAQQQPRGLTAGWTAIDG